MSKYTAVVLDAYTLNPGDLDWKSLEEICDLTVYDKTEDCDVLERAKDAEIIFTNKVAITRTLIDALTKLKFIGVLATGYNIVDVDYAREKNIIVSNIPSYSSDSVAELVMAYILEFSFNIGKHSVEVHNGKWASSEHFCYHSFPLHEIRGKTLGIFGLGNIGQQIMKLALAFGMKVIFTNRSKKYLQGKYASVKQVELESLLKESDFISLNAPLNEGTKHIINAKTLKLCKKTAYLITTARGPLVNELDVAEALKAGTIAAYGTDVLALEPPAKDNPLFGLKNCIITPHIAWQTLEARTRLLDILVNNVKAFIAGKPINRVN